MNDAWSTSQHQIIFTHINVLGMQHLVFSTMHWEELGIGNNFELR